MQGWTYSEPSLDNRDFGSGYPSDPKCKKWLDDALQDRVFGYPDVVRFSWAPVKARLLEDKVARVVFPADLDDEEKEQMQSQKKMSVFLSSGNAENKKRKLSSYFKSRKLQTVTMF